MGTWKSRGLRGSRLEELINFTNNLYYEKSLAVIQKVPTSITPVALDQKQGYITKAFFEQKSTVDYIGAVQGIPVCFDAKEISKKSLPMQNIHEHQIQFMKKFIEQKGISFLLVNFSSCDEIYYLPFEVLYEYYLQSKNGGRKSIPYDGFDKSLKVRSKDKFPVHYLEQISICLERNNSIISKL